MRKLAFLLIGVGSVAGAFQMGLIGPGKKKPSMVGKMKTTSPDTFSKKAGAPETLPASQPAPQPSSLPAATTGAMTLTARGAEPSAAAGAEPSGNPLGTPSILRGGLSSAAAAEIVAFAPKKGRDPTLSPADLNWIAQKKLEEELAKKRLAYKPVKVAPRVVSIEHQLTIMGIILVGGNRSAIINNKILKEGESIRGAKILRIQSNSVTFKHAKKTFTKVIKK